MVAGRRTAAALCADRARSPATWLELLCGIVAAAAAAAATSESFKINITEPLHHYAGPEGCSLSYDLVRPELLIFNVDVEYEHQNEHFSVVIFNSTASRVRGCRKFCQPSLHSTCSVRCNVSHVPDVSSYVVKASSDVLHARAQRTMCINARDVAYVHFISRRPLDVWSADGSIELVFEADGYPRPISYELSCEGRQPLASPNGTFKLVGLPNGTTECRAVANTSRRFNRTEPLNISIRVDTSKLHAGTSISTEDVSTWSYGTADTSNIAKNTSSAESNETETVAISYTNDSTSFISESAATESAVLIAGLLACCTVLVMATLVGFIAHMRHSRRTCLVSSDGGAATVTAAQHASSGSTTTVAGGEFLKFCRLCAPCCAPTSIINNNSTHFNFFGNTYEIYGAVRTLIVNSLRRDGVTGSPVSSRGSTSSITTTPPPPHDASGRAELGGGCVNPSFLQSTLQLDDDHLEVNDGGTALRLLRVGSNEDYRCGEEAAEAQAIHPNRQLCSLPPRTSPSAALQSDDQETAAKSRPLRTASIHGSGLMHAHEASTQNCPPPYVCPTEEIVAFDDDEAAIE